MGNCEPLICVIQISPEIPERVLRNCGIVSGANLIYHCLCASKSLDSDDVLTLVSGSCLTQVPHPFCSRNCLCLIGWQFPKSSFWGTGSRASYHTSTELPTPPTPRCYSCLHEKLPGAGRGVPGNTVDLEVEACAILRHIAPYIHAWYGWGRWGPVHFHHFVYLGGL